MVASFQTVTTLIPFVGYMAQPNSHILNISWLLVPKHCLFKSGKAQDFIQFFNVCNFK